MVLGLVLLIGGAVILSGYRHWVREEQLRQRRARR
jgi:hypothetical protein